MLTQGEIRSIEYESNTCTVRIPIFETVQMDSQVVIPARFAVQPGVFNGYSVGDVVWLGFELEAPEYPVVLGRIYQGVRMDKGKSNGVVQADSLRVTTNATLPKNTTFAGLPLGYGDILSIVKRLQTVDRRTRQQKRWCVDIGLGSNGRILVEASMPYSIGTAELLWHKLADVSSKGLVRKEGVAQDASKLKMIPAAGIYKGTPVYGLTAGYDETGAALVRPNANIAEAIAFSAVTAINNTDLSDL